MKGRSVPYVESVIKRASAGEMATGQAASKLGCTKQYVNRLKKKYGAAGKAAFRHGNAGRKKAWRTDAETERRVVALYGGEYSGFNFRHFLEKLGECEGIRLTYPTLRRILAEAGARSHKCHKSKKRPSEHPSRPRKDRFGEMLQIDASIHPWFGKGNPKATLHGAVDDATGTVMGLFFDGEETLRGYHEMAHQIFAKYGIPACFYADNRTIFEFRKLSERDKTADRDVHINFRRMCQQLGIELITTSVAQVKGRIERLWGTLQSRLVSELKSRGIATIEGANAYLPEFMADYNRRFALAPDLESSLFAPPPSGRELDFYLSTQYQRKTDNGSCIGLFGKRMTLVDSDARQVRVPPKTVLDLYVTRRGKMVAEYSGEIYELAEAPKTESAAPIKKPGRPKWIPPKGHPWRKFIVNPKKPGNK